MWSESIKRLKGKYGFKLLPPLPKKIVETLVAKFGLGHEYVELYCVTNGLALEWFRVLPIQDESNLKSTWDSIQKANDPEKSKFGVDEKFLERFVVIAEIGHDACAVYDKSDGSIWYEEGEELNQTDLSLEEFIETCLMEVSQL